MEWQLPAFVLCLICTCKRQLCAPVSSLNVHTFWAGCVPGITGHAAGACGRQGLTWLRHVSLDPMCPPAAVQRHSFDESRRACRARIWGSAGMPRALMADKDCWLQLMSLDPVTGLDPEGTRLRAHEGLDGVDFFVPVRTSQCSRGVGTAQ